MITIEVSPKTLDELADKLPVLSRFTEQKMADTGKFNLLFRDFQTGEPICVTELPAANEKERTDE